MTSTSMIDVGGECNGRRPIDAWCMMRTESIVNVMVFYFPSYSYSYSYSYSFIILSLNTIQYNTKHIIDDRSLQQHQMYPPTTPTPSPHLQSMQYQQTQNRRTTSFDGEFLPPSALGEDSTSAVYATGGTLFSAQQPWGYNAGTGPLPPNSPYTQHTQVQQNQQLQQQQQQQQQQQNSVQSHHQQNQIRSPPRGRQGRGGGNPGANPGAAGGQPPNFYPAATPGPPIQTTAHNKGPEGANLFIFHIPNHFTNLDMWHLFCHYGNLLSVRIMVEKDTGRSRGFGFVSYDSPDAAALAIKELNGFVVSFCLFVFVCVCGMLWDIYIYHVEFADAHSFLPNIHHVNSIQPNRNNRLATSALRFNINKSDKAK